MEGDRAGNADPREAAERPAGAEREFAAGGFNHCANRACSASFRAAIAAPRRAGIGPSGRDRLWRHDAVQARFAEQPVDRRTLYPGAFRETFQRGPALRVVADDTPGHVDETQVPRGLRRSRRFVGAIRGKGATR